jgi:FkbM family methyltransferase
MQGRYVEARRLIDRTYQLRPWINDRIAVHYPFNALQGAAEKLPDWPWPKYQLSRERWRAVGASLTAAVLHVASTSDSVQTFVQIGANDGKSGDPLHRLIQQGQLQGLLVEPQEAPFVALQKRYEAVAGLAFEQAAVVDKDGPVTMHTTEDRTTLGTLLPERNIMRLRKAWQEVSVPGMTIRTLLHKHGIAAFDLLQIDTEGYDYHVLKQVDLSENEVKIVNMEFYCLPITERIATMSQLDEEGFAWFFDGMDLLALRRDLFSDIFCITDLLVSVGSSARIELS